jgi:hypothetical protein
MPSDPSNMFVNGFVTHSVRCVRSSELSHCTYWSFVLCHAVESEQTDVSRQFHSRIALPPLKEDYLLPLPRTEPCLPTNCQSLYRLIHSGFYYMRVQGPTTHILSIIYIDRFAEVSKILICKLETPSASSMRKHFLRIFILYFI